MDELVQQAFAVLTGTAAATAGQSVLLAQTDTARYLWERIKTALRGSDHKELPEPGDTVRADWLLDLLIQVGNLDSGALTVSTGPITITGTGNATGGSSVSSTGDIVGGNKSTN